VPACRLRSHLRLKNATCFELCEIRFFSCAITARFLATAKESPVRICSTFGLGGVCSTEAQGPIALVSRWAVAWAATAPERRGTSIPVRRANSWRIPSTCRPLLQSSRKVIAVTPARACSLDRYAKVLADARNSRKVQCSPSAGHKILVFLLIGMPLSRPEYTEGRPHFSPSRSVNGATGRRATMPFTATRLNSCIISSLSFAPVATPRCPRKRNPSVRLGISFAVCVECFPGIHRRSGIGLRGRMAEHSQRLQRRMVEQKTIRYCHDAATEKNLEGDWLPIKFSQRWPNALRPSMTRPSCAV